MADATWRRRYVQDLLFEIDGAGWHDAEMRDAVGYRWSGPGRFSILRMPGPAGAGLGEAHLLLMPGEAIPDVVVFLNGHRLVTTARRLGGFGVLDFAWDAAVTAGAATCELWFHAAQTIRLPAPGERMRSLGFRLSTVTLESTAEGPGAAGEEAALIAGRRFLADRLPVVTGRARVALRRDGEARLIEMRFEGARLGPAPQAELAVAVRAAGPEITLAAAAAGTGVLRARLAEGVPFELPASAAPRDALLLCRLLAGLPEAFGRWAGEAAQEAAPDVGMLAECRLRLADLARGAHARMVALLADGPDPFLGDPDRPFAWPEPEVSS